MVQPRDEVGEADRIDVEDRRRVGIVADAARIAGDEHEIAQAHGVRAEQIGLDAQQVAVAARVVQQRFDARLLLDQHGERQGADARAGALAVRDVDHVHARDTQPLRPLDDLIGLVAARRQQLHGDDERATRHGVGQSRFVLASDRRRRDRGHRSGAGPGVSGTPHRRRHPANRGLDLADVLGRRPATAAHHAHVVHDEPPRVRRHVLGRAEVDVAAFDIARLAGVGLRREPALRDGRHALDGVEHRGGTDGAVDADHRRAAALEVGCEALRRRAVQRVAVFLRRHLGDDWQAGHAPHGVDRRADFVEIAEGLEDEQIDAALHERMGLLAEEFACFVEAGLPPRLDADAQRADRPGDVRVLQRRMARDLRALCVDRVEPLGKAERAQLDAVRAERVGLDNVGAGTDVFLVHLGHEIGLRDVQRVEAFVDEDALRIEHRPHRAVTDEDPVVKSFDKRLQHLVIG